MPKIKSVIAETPEDPADALGLPRRRRFRECGLEGIGVADVMKEAGPTVGGFYEHFGSRDELVVEAFATAFQDLDVWEEHTADMAQLVDNYLTEAHRDAA